jgi:LuxR family maltose regulon positive regulatory protein
MADHLLSTKMTVPPAVPGRISRPRLLHILDQGSRPGNKLTIISAPAGYGKTSLLSDWAPSQPDPLVWLSLDESDNDPARLLAYLWAGIEHALPTGGQRPPSRFEGALTPLVNRLARSAGRLVLVLDDYHRIHSPDVHRGVQFLIQHAPESLHLVLATRVDPPLSLGSLRGRGELTEIRAHDLLFSAEEAAEFLARALERELSPVEVSALTDRTEGWIAGLQLAALSLRGRPDTAAFIAEFSGSHTYIVDYLTDEVLEQQPDDRRDFLLRTSILDRLSAPLCDALTGRSDSWQQLEWMRGANLFLVPLDYERRWYRYHHLFAQLLRQRLELTRPQEIPGLHRRASSWFEEYFDVDRAIRHALAGQDHRRAAQLIDDSAEATLMRSETVTVLTWLKALPPPLISERPRLAAYWELANMLTGRPLDPLSPAAGAAPARGAEGAIPERGIIPALTATLKGDARTGSDLSRELLDTLPKDRLFLRSALAWNLAMAQVASGDFSTAAAGLETVIQLSAPADNAMFQVLALCHLAEVKIWGGLLQEALADYQRALELAQDAAGQTLPIGGMAHTGLAELYRQWNDLETAEQHAQQGLVLIADWAAVGVAEGEVTLARIRQARGDFDGAERAFERAARAARAFSITEIDDLVVAANRTRLWIERGQLDRADRWARDRVQAGLMLEPAGWHSALDGPLAFYDICEFEWLTLARLWIARGDLGPAIELLDEVGRQAQELGRITSLIDSLIQNAVARHLLGETPAALAAIEAALDLAEPQRFIQIFLTPPIHGLLREALAHNIRPVYVAQLLGAVEGRRTIHPRPAALIEQLSQRELQVLRLLNTHLSSTEIANHLSISPNTVRSHIKQIYGKLGVHSRSEAVDAAREIGLL